MTDEARKKEKALEKLAKAVRKAVERGVGAEEASAAMQQAILDASRGGSTTPEADSPATAETRKLPGLNKYSNITLKWGVTDDNDIKAKVVTPKELAQPAAEEPSLKKLPGKRKPPTLTLKRGKNG